MRRLHPGRLTNMDLVLDLLPTDRIFQRWARSVGSGLDLPWEGEHGGPSPLPEDAAMWVDRYVCDMHPAMKKFIHSWYRGQDASAVIAKRFCIGRDAVYTRWRSYLWIARADFLREPCVASLMVTALEAA